jgi:hypothetical protein
MGTVTKVRSTLQEWDLPKYLHYMVTQNTAVVVSKF